VRSIKKKREEREAQKARSGDIVMPDEGNDDIFLTEEGTVMRASPEEILISNEEIICILNRPLLPR
jgi:hypothetical protein